ncbi:GGDEF domain-containing protein [Pseudomarimonas salicorniae]|uniref:diguanylate cyclase n=1 Tax=Pseudomarimonas salicorniae TaxID=2933270 RepID=A0ABT0GIL6_9GAMM|nr:GGDEF domain-containing protein [Lysobacter sp. CAU 1642]MCK7594380.1 GGDEF domain-containing protein [Lysobacter sp. CAU 1642]
MSLQGARWLDEVVKLTAIRDVELLELSLLHTLREFLAPEALSLFRLDAQGRPVYEMRCGREGAPSILERPAIDPEVLALARDIGRGGGASFHHGPGLGVFAVSEMRGLPTFLVVRGIAAEDVASLRMIQGFLRFFENYCGLLEYSQRDQLTGLMNRKTFDESVYKLFAASPQALAEPGPVAEERRGGGHTGEHWMAMVDIDHFKRINDSHGHLYGDEVLLLVAQLMKCQFRKTDMLFRFGGEEFVIIARRLERGAALNLFERLRSAIAAQRFPQIRQVTASLGLTRVVRGTPIPVLLDRADKALYFAKQNGRDRVAVYEDLLDEGKVAEAQIETGSVDLF